MRRSFLDSVLRGAEALAARDGVGTLSDSDLVGRFAAGQDPAAFAVLVRRHGPLVWAVCRNLLPADADAEDAFQATFLALVRSVGSIRRTEALAGWLHGVAYRVAIKARRASARRKQREAKAAVPEPSSPVPDAAWDELQAAVHEEVCKLPDKFRLPFVLCGLQGRSQKEAAEVLGWKVGTVSGRLSEARRTLLDRLARRGVPAGVAAGAAVLGGVAGHAAVPPSLTSKVLSVAGSPVAVPSNVLSLARGVTPMYLTRTKLLAAGVVVAGLLTTSVGVLSRADAQPPPSSAYEDAIRKYQDALRSHQAPRDRWEYRFVAVDKPLTTADLQKVLTAADQEGWSYCGSQDLVHGKTDKVAPHMVFKRPRIGGVADDATPGPRQAAAAALAELVAKEAATRDRMAAFELLMRKQADAERAKAEAAERDMLKSRKVADDRAAAEKAALDQAARAKEAEAHLRAEVEKAIRAAATVQDEATARAATERALREQEAARRKQLEAMKAQYENLINQLQAELKAKSATPPRKAESGKKPEPQASNPFGADTDGRTTARVPLQHVDGKTAADHLARVWPAAKVVAQVTPDSITLMGSTEQVVAARAVIQQVIDTVATGAAQAGEPGYAMFRLKYIAADEVVKALEKATDGEGAKFVAVPATNSLLASGSSAMLADVKKLVASLDVEKGPAK